MCWHFTASPYEHFKQCRDHYAQEDVWVKGGQGILRTGWVGVEQSLCPEEKLTKSEFYSDFSRHCDVFHQCGGILQQTASAQDSWVRFRASLYV